MTHDEMIAVIQAHKEGKPIELRQRYVAGSNPWTRRPADRDNLFDFVGWEYRIAKEPREFDLVFIAGQPPGRAWVYYSDDSSKVAQIPGGTCIKVKEIL